MVHQKSTVQSDLRTVLDVLMIALGMVGGGLTALLGLWLWFDYQAGPADSILVGASSVLVAALPVGLRAQLGDQARLMGLPLVGETSAYWYMARAGGAIAYLLMWGSTVWGLLLSTKVVSKQVSPALAYGVHEFASILTIIFAVLHAMVLLGDKYIDFSLIHLLIPFTAPYEPLWTGLGIIALYLSAAITASFYIRKHIGQKVWRILHYLTFVAYLLALAHAIMAGSDSGLIISVLLYWSTGFMVIFLVYYRLFTAKRS
jgi:hypothetical protein